MIPQRLPIPVLLVVVLAVIGGCASPRPAAPVSGGDAPWESVESAAPSLGAAWTVPASLLQTQRLYRVSYDGPEGDGGFRLTLVLSDEDRYQVRTVDPLGRALWTLDVAGEAGIWRDHRNRLTCSLEGAFDLAAARLAPFPLAALPALLLGRMPAVPVSALETAAPAGPEETAGRLAFRDAEGRRWTARLEAGLPSAWALYEAGEPILQWSRQGDEAYLSDRRRGSQLRWRESLSEPLAQPLPATLSREPVEGYRQVDCAAAYAG